MSPITPTSESGRPRPLLVFDGDCRFCRQWVSRWRQATGDRIRYEAYQSVAWKYPEVSDREFKHSIQYFEGDGRRRQGADAVFHSLAQGDCWLGKLLATLYDRISFFAGASEGAYRLVANNRSFFSLITQWIFGDDVSRPEFTVGMRLFLKGVAFIYLIALVSYWIQLPGLVGSQGILPAPRFFDFVSQALGRSKFWIAPSLCWWGGAGDIPLAVLCTAGIVLSLFALLGIAEAPALFGVYAIYLSLCTAGQIFYLFQWDSLLLEAGFLAAIAASWRGWTGWRAGRPPRMAQFLVLWLLFRLMFSSGMAKWLGGDLGWSNFTAMGFHYFTQPLPTPLAWYEQQGPAWVQHASVWVVFFVEIFLPFLLFAPGRLRLIAVAGIAMFQILIAATGNYGFFNLLTLLLCIPSVEDRWWPSGLRHRLSGGAPLRLPRPVLAVACVVLFSLGWVSLSGGGGRRIPRLLSSAYEVLRPFQIVNGYGLFVRMTTSRHEIQLEGSRDGLEWKPYIFRYKPGALSRPPPWIAPYMPRLDWMMWFAALGSVEQNQWLIALMEQILRGSPTVLALLESNPFPEHPPRYLRAPLDNYRFTTSAERRTTGNWWKAEPLGYYVHPAQLRYSLKNKVN